MNQNKKQPKQLTLFGLLEEAKADAEFDEERRKIEDERRATYYSLKVGVLKLEQSNNSRVILIPSPTGEVGEWYITGGNSALFYKHFLGPCMGRKNVKIRKDTDLRHQFKHGVAAIRGREQFEKGAKRAGYSVEEIGQGVLAVELNKKFTASEIKGMRELEKQERDKLESILKPTYNNPDFYRMLRELDQLVLPRASKINIEYRMTVGCDLVSCVTQLYKTYFQIDGKKYTVLEGMEKIVDITDEMRALVMAADEVNAFDLVTRTRIGEVVVDVSNAAKAIIVSLEKGEHETKRLQDKENDDEEGNEGNGENKDESTGQKTGSRKVSKKTKGRTSKNKQKARRYFWRRHKVAKK